MKKFELFGSTIAISKNEKIHDAWKKLEAYVVGKPCKSLDELLVGLYENWLANSDGHGVQSSSDSKMNAGDDRIEALRERISQLEGELHKMNSIIEEKETQIRSLNNSNTSLSEENVEIRSAVSKLKGLFSILSDELISSSDYIETAKIKGLTAETVCLHMESQIDQSLQKIGISSLAETGKTFDNRFQRIVTIQETDDCSKNNIVAESLGKGYRQGDYCIREQDVIVYKYKGDNI